MGIDDLPVSQGTRGMKSESESSVQRVESEERSLLNDKLTEEQSTIILTEGAKLINRVLDIVHLKENTDATLKIMDKDIEKIKNSTECEIKKMVADTDSWEKKFEKVSDLLQEMTLTVTKNKDLPTEVMVAMINTTKAMIDKI